MSKMIVLWPYLTQFQLLLHLQWPRPYRAHNNDQGHSIIFTR